MTGARSSFADDEADRPRRRWLRWIGAAIGFGLIAYLAWRVDWRQFATVLGAARVEYVLVTFFVIVLEQTLRAWKWRQILVPLCRVGTWLLFGAVMAGYLANLLIPLGLSPFVRSWLVARKKAISMSSVLATVAIDRLVDGLVFAAIVFLVVTAAAIPDPEGSIGRGLLLGAGGSAVAIIAAFLLLAGHKRQAASGIGLLLALANRLPQRFEVRARTFAIAFADGIVWPRERWRGLAIVLSGLAIKLIAASHLLWAGLAVGVRLDPLAYFALLAILGFIIILAHMARIPAGFVVGAVFALGLFGLGEAVALAMVTIVMAANMTAVLLFGGWGLWSHGIRLGELTRRKVPGNGG